MRRCLLTLLMLLASARTGAAQTPAPQAKAPDPALRRWFEFQQFVLGTRYRIIETSADVVAVHPTVTLFLPTQQILELVRTNPAVLAELYLLAVQRDDETNAILDEEASVAEDFDLL